MKWAIYWVFISPLMEEVVTPADGWGYSYSSYEACMLAASDETYSFKLLTAWLIEKHPFDRPLYEHIRDHNTVECRMVGDVGIV